MGRKRRSSPRYFRDKQSWPRAGVVTPPRKKTPVNFSWEAAATARVSGQDGARRNGVGFGREFTPEEQGGEEIDRDGRFVNGRYAGDELDRAPGEEGGWKSKWARRFARGPIQSEYQDRFLWPTLLPRTSSPLAHAASAAPSKNSIPFATDVGSASASAASAVAPVISRRVLGLSAAGRKGEGGRDAKNARFADKGVTSSQASARRRVSLPPQGKQRPPPSAQSSDAVKAAGRRRGGSERFLSDAASPPSRPPAARVASVAAEASLGRESAWEVVEHVDGKFDDAREGSGQNVMEAAVEARTSLRGASRIAEKNWDKAYLGEGKEDASVGQEEATMTGGRTIDYSSESIMTEYMQEFVWPTEGSVPGRRGKRTGMGMDQVGRLLAGKRAEEPRKPPDPSLVARLGVAADRALKAAPRGHLAEMCRLKSPPSTARRLVLALVIALGLRWRRWDDIRSRFLRSMVDLVEFLQSFDKDRPGLISASLRPFVDDPHLSPAEVRQVSASMVWLSRWLRALHDYLAVKEGNTDAVPLSRTLLASASRAGDGRAATTRRRSRSHAPTLSLGKLPTSTAVTIPEDATARTADVGMARTCMSGPSKAAIGGTPADHDYNEGLDVAEEVNLSAAALSRVRLSPVLDHVPGAGAGAGAVVAPEGSSPEAVAEAVRERRGGDSTQRYVPEATSTRGATRETSSSRARTFSIISEEGAVIPGVEGNEMKAAEHEDDGDGGDLGSESVWTTGALTSQGSIMGDSTDDQVGATVGVSVSVSSPVAVLAREERFGYGDVHEGSENGGKGRGVSTGSSWKDKDRGAGRPSTAGQERRVFTLQDGVSVAGRRYNREGAATVRGALPRKRGTDAGFRSSDAPRALHACVYHHQPKGLTASHFANPKARRLPRERRNPILAHTRWPTPVEVRERERTEQRSAFSVDSSLVAFEAGR